MTEPITFPPQPFGYVAGRWVLSTGDTVNDEDREPDYVSVDNGTVTFKPIIQTRIVPDNTDHQDGWAGIINKSVHGKIGSHGQLIDAEGQNYLALAVGLYDVSYDFPGSTWPSHTIEVKAEHTETNPLWLPTEIETPTGKHVVTVVKESDRIRAEAAASVAEDARDETIVARDETVVARDETVAAADRAEILAPILADKVSGTGMTVRVDTTVGTRVMLDHPGGTTMIYGDTGWRKLPVDPEWTGADLLVRRVGNVVEMQLFDPAREVVPKTTITTLPQGFIPRGIIRSLFSENGGTPNKLIAVSATISVYGRTPNASLQAMMITYTTTNPWPTT